VFLGLWRLSEALPHRGEEGERHAESAALAGFVTVFAWMITEARLDANQHDACSSKPDWRRWWALTLLSLAAPLAVAPVLGAVYGATLLLQHLHVSVRAGLGCLWLAGVVVSGVQYLRVRRRG